MYTTTIIAPTTYSLITVTDAGLIDTNIVAIAPTQTPIPTLSVVTTVDPIYTDVTMVDVLLPHGAGTTITVS